MIQGLYNVIAGIAVLALVYVNVLSPFFGSAMYEATKHIGVYFAVGSSEQLTVDSDGDVVTTGTLNAGAATVDEFTQGAASLTLPMPTAEPTH